MLCDLENIESYYLSDVNSDRLIHPMTKIVDFNFEFNSKDKILKQIQFWKNYFQVNKIKTISLHDHLSLNSVAIFFACMESSITIYTCRKRQQDLLRLADCVDLIIVADSCKSAYIEHPKCFLLENIVYNVDLPDYYPDTIDLDQLLLVGNSSGTTGKSKIIKHTVRTFINASIISTFFYKPGQAFASYPNINHIGMAAVMTCAPALAGVTIYSCKSVLELMVLISRQLFDIIGLFDLQVEQWKYIENFITTTVPLMGHYVNFGHADLITAGSSPGPTLADYFFSKNGKRIRSFYGSNETLAPNFIIDITDKHFDFSKRKLGEKIPGTDYKISADNELILKNPGLSVFIDHEDGWYKTADYAVELPEGLIFKGRHKINEKFYILDIHNQIHTCIFHAGVEIDQYFLNYKNNCITVYTRHQFVVDAVNHNIDSIKQVINHFGTQVDLNCSILDDSEHLEIKSVPIRYAKDYL